MMEHRAAGSLFHSSLTNSDSFVPDTHTFVLNAISQILFDPDPITIYDNGFFSEFFTSFVQMPGKSNPSFFEAAIKSQNARQHLRIVTPPSQRSKTVAQILSRYRAENRAGHYRTSEFFGDKLGETQIDRLFLNPLIPRGSNLGTVCASFFQETNITQAQYRIHSQNESKLYNDFLETYAGFCREAIDREETHIKTEDRLFAVSNVLFNYLELTEGIKESEIRSVYGGDPMMKIVSEVSSPERRSHGQLFVKLLSHIYGLEIATRYNLAFNFFDTDALFTTLWNTEAQGRRSV